MDGFGARDAEMSKLATVKRVLREGRAIWFRAEASPEHLVNAKWFTQCCRMAHRAGVCWSLKLRAPEAWKTSTLLALKRLKYARGSTMVHDGVSIRLLVSDAVDVNQMSDKGFLRQTTARLESGEPEGLATVSLGRELSSATAEECQFKWYQRAVEDSQALGGLRNPHRSAEQLTGAKSVGAKLQRCIDEHVAAHWCELEKALQTVGAAHVPTALTEAATVICGKAAECFNSEAAPAEQLQGKLLPSISEELQDPNKEVLRWLVDECAPLGIRCPMELGGAFPTMEPAKAVNELDEWADSWITLLMGSTVEGAERLSRREIESGWILWYPDEAAVVEAHGPVTFSRIGAVAKEKGESLKLRLIHDLRRSGVN